MRAAPRRPSEGYLCVGCGAFVPAGAHPFACPAREGDPRDVEHALERVGMEGSATWSRAWEPNPFMRWRELTWAHRFGRLNGLSETELRHVFLELDRAVAKVDGHGFRQTPFAPTSALGARTGGAELWVKDDTGNVGGSHKARHLMGVALYLEVAGLLGLDDGARPLAIASCGNAALAAAVVARAAERPLSVFIPTDADAAVLARLEALGADVRVCAREDGVAGDPCYHAFREAVRAGALPFCVQGPDCAVTLDGGETLAWELAEVCEKQGVELDRVYVQVGGGALATAIINGFERARRLGAIARAPRLIAVQSAGCWPLARAWARVTATAFAHLEREAPDDMKERAEALLAEPAAVEAALEHARTHRSAIMTPWETPPQSVAHGILDDETYDWYALVRGMLRSGGWPVVVEDGAIIEATGLARDALKVEASPTGAAGLAGALVDLERHPAPGEKVAVILSGVAR